jgi:hypothetical protein
VPGERRLPNPGIEHSKPRARIRKLPAAEIEEASRIYLKERNATMRMRRMREAKERDQLD